MEAALVESDTGAQEGRGTSFGEQLGETTSLSLHRDLASSRPS